MSMNMTRSVILSVVTFIGCQSVAAEELKSIDCSVHSYDGKSFGELYKEAGEVAKEFCKQLVRSRIDRDSVENAHIASMLQDFSKQAEKALNDKGLQVTAEYHEQFSGLRTTFAEFDIRNMVMPEFVSHSNEGYFSPEVSDTKRFVINEVDHCATVGAGQTCNDLFDDFANAFNVYRSAYDNIYDNAALIKSMGAEWDKFLQVSKSQTALEVLLTTLAHNKHFRKNHLVGPPTYQIIALHPQLVYNSMEKAPDGSNQEMGLAVEWAGINFWNLKLPLGISVASVYVDRAIVDGVGHGLMLHIDNRYSIGWADHGEEDSFYITLDLLKLFEDKKEKYDQYTNRL